VLGLFWSAIVAAPAGGCPSLVDATVAGKAGALTALLARCSAADLIRAVDRAAGKVDLSRFARDARGGGGDVISWKARHRVRWTGTCVAQVDEALPAADRLPAAACLVDAWVADEYDPNELSDSDDDRARFLADHPALAAAFQSCTGAGGDGSGGNGASSGERCLDHLLPRSGRQPSDDPDIATWIKLRDAATPRAVPLQREMRCHAVLADQHSFVVRCEGTLAQSVCNSESTPIQSVVTPRCTSDHSLVVPVSLGEKPSEECLTATRAAVWASPPALAAARRRALAACAPSTAAGAAGQTAGVRDSELPATARSLIGAVLRRQRELAGPIKLPPPCTKAGVDCPAGASPGGMIASPGGVIGRRVAQGCGFDVWSVVVPGDAGVGGDRDDWIEWHGQPLVRVKAGHGPVEPPTIGERDRGAPWFAIGNTLRQGSLLSAPAAAGKATATFSELAAALCGRRGVDGRLCATYAALGQPPDLASAIADGRWRRMRQAMKRDWPTAYRRFEAQQKALERGLALDRVRGETRRQTCQPLLIDACSGDIGEMCVVTDDERKPPCPQRRLPDGRCPVYRFARLGSASGD